MKTVYLANICLFKDSNRNTKKRCDIRSKLTIKTTERLLETALCSLWSKLPDKRNTNQLEQIKSGC